MCRILEVYEEALGQRLNNEKLQYFSAKIQMRVPEQKFSNLWES